MSNITGEPGNVGRWWHAPMHHRVTQWAHTGGQPTSVTTLWLLLHQSPTCRCSEAKLKAGCRDKLNTVPLYSTSGGSSGGSVVHHVTDSICWRWSWNDVKLVEWGTCVHLAEVGLFFTVETSGHQHFSPTKTTAGSVGDITPTCVHIS